MVGTHRFYWMTRMSPIPDVLLQQIAACHTDLNSETARDKTLKQHLHRSFGLRHSHCQPAFVPASWRCLRRILSADNAQERRRPDRSQEAAAASTRSLDSARLISRSPSIWPPGWPRSTAMLCQWSGTHIPPKPGPFRVPLLGTRPH